MNYKFDAEHTFFTSDTHFNHTNIIQYCHRPFKNVDQMNETLITNWNHVIHPEDTIFHLGDFCLGDSTEWNKILNRLNGKIYLIMGNHDRKNIQQGYINRFEDVVMQMHIEVGKRSIYLNHYPFLCYSGAYGDVWQLFGHVHTCPNSTGIDTPRLGTLLPTQYDVGVDNNNYMPVSYEQVKKNILKQINKTRNEKEK